MASDECQEALNRNKSKRDDGKLNAPRKRRTSCQICKFSGQCSCITLPPRLIPVLFAQGSNSLLEIPAPLSKALDNANTKNVTTWRKAGTEFFEQTLPRVLHPWSFSCQVGKPFFDVAIKTAMLSQKKSAQKTFIVLRVIRRNFIRVTRLDLQMLYRAYAISLLEYVGQVFYQAGKKGDTAYAFVVRGENGLEDITRIDAKKDLGIWLPLNKSFSLQHDKRTQEAFTFLQMSRRTFSRITRMDFQILCGTNVSPLLEYDNQVTYSRDKKDVTFIERVQRAATKMVSSIKFVEYETRLAVLDLFPQEYRRLRGDLILTYTPFE
ncbi:hypothetical protein CLF_104697 [Clonorchis sinensis]|uniref:Uncharacterized protein n=1 Tax=Clonorchis sinensis TaxID=79923 RepID=G7YC54_CLOSI|nr:hypothetical protein CLF_104697 [Clonorchis sinensis]